MITISISDIRRCVCIRQTLNLTLVMFDYLKSTSSIDVMIADECDCHLIVLTIFVTNPVAVGQSILCESLQSREHAMLQPLYQDMPSCPILGAKYKKIALLVIVR